VVKKGAEEDEDNENEADFLSNFSSRPATPLNVVPHVEIEKGKSKCNLGEVGIGDGEKIKDEDLFSALCYKCQKEDVNAENNRISTFLNNILRWRRFRVNITADEAAICTKDREEIAKLQRWLVLDLIFAAVIVLNGILIGIQVDDETYKYFNFGITEWLIVDLIFLSIFIFEIALRLKLDPTITGWIIFDVVIIAVGVADFIFTAIVEKSPDVSEQRGDAATAVQGPPGFLVVFRLLRLFRLWRLVRLVKLLHELLLLVSAFGKAGRILFWALVLLALLTYIGSLILEMLPSLLYGIKPGESALIPEYWDGWLLSMFTLFQIATFDDWTKPMDDIYYNYPWIYPLLFIFCLFLRFGLFNYVVSMVAHSVIVMKAEAEPLIAAKVQMRRQLALDNLEKALKTFNGRPHERSPKSMTRAELFIAFKEGMFSELEGLTFELIVKISDNILLTRDVSSQESDAIDIDELLEAISWGLCTDFGFLDMMFLRRHVESVNLLSEKIEGQAENSFKNHGETLDILRTMARSATNCKEELDEYDEDQTRQRTVRSRLSAYGVFADRNKKMETCTQVSQKKITTGQSMIRFEQLSCFIILSNLFILGFQADDFNGQERIEWLIVDYSFLAVFAVELVLRALNVAQIEGGDPRLVLGLFPRCPIEWANIKYHKRTIFLDISYLFDVFVVLVCSLRFSFGNTFAVVRLLRLVRFLRLHHFAAQNAELKLLLRCGASAMTTVMCACMMLFIFTLVITIGLLSFKPTDLMPSEPHCGFQTIIDSMMILLRMVTADAWAEGMTCLHRYYGALGVIVIGAYLLVCYLGIMNLIVGVMVENANHHIVETAREKSEIEERDYNKRISNLSKEAFAMANEDELSYSRCFGLNEHWSKVTRGPDLFAAFAKIEDRESKADVSLLLETCRPEQTVTALDAHALKTQVASLRKEVKLLRLSLDEFQIKQMRDICEAASTTFLINVQQTVERSLGACDEDGNRIGGRIMGSKDKSRRSPRGQGSKGSETPPNSAQSTPRPKKKSKKRTQMAPPQKKIAMAAAAHTGADTPPGTGRSLQKIRAKKAYKVAMSLTKTGDTPHSETIEKAMLSLSSLRRICAPGGQDDKRVSGPVEKKVSVPLDQRVNLAHRVGTEELQLLVLSAKEELANARDEDCATSESGSLRSTSTAGYAGKRDSFTDDMPTIASALPSLQDSSPLGKFRLAAANSEKMAKEERLLRKSSTMMSLHDVQSRKMSVGSSSTAKRDAAGALNSARSSLQRRNSDASMGSQRNPKAVPRLDFAPTHRSLDDMVSEALAPFDVGGRFSRARLSKNSLVISRRHSSENLNDQRAKSKTTNAGASTSPHALLTRSQSMPNPNVVYDDFAPCNAQDAEDAAAIEAAKRLIETEGKSLDIQHKEKITFLMEENVQLREELRELRRESALDNQHVRSGSPSRYSARFAPTAYRSNTVPITPINPLQNTDLGLDVRIPVRSPTKMDVVVSDSARRSKSSRTPRSSR